MAVRQAFIAAPPKDVWAALADGGRYADWVVGTRAILHEDPGWPAVGSRIEFEAGIGPLTLRDQTVVRVCEPPERLEMEIKAGVFGAVRVAFQLIEWGEGTVVIVDEHPLRGLAGGLHGPPGELVLHLRNRLMLRNLRHVVHDERDKRASAGRAEPAEQT
ncbi:SRPBCC family protein [Actinomadura kijaniata]|uniref:SRPBCC family protein n=1 Tax=Actinomadura kijaniata TaxID=46161 RepID=UPI003F19E790